MDIKKGINKASRREVTIVGRYKDVNGSFSDSVLSKFKRRGKKMIPLSFPNQSIDVDRINAIFDEKEED